MQSLQAYSFFKDIHDSITSEDYAQKNKGFIELSTYLLENEHLHVINSQSLPLLQITLYNVFSQNLNTLASSLYCLSCFARCDETQSCISDELLALINTYLVNFRDRDIIESCISIVYEHHLKRPVHVSKIIEIDSLTRNLKLVTNHFKLHILEIIIKIIDFHSHVINTSCFGDLLDIAEKHFVKKEEKQKVFLVMRKILAHVADIESIEPLLPRIMNFLGDVEYLNISDYYGLVEFISYRGPRGLYYSKDIHWGDFFQNRELTTDLSEKIICITKILLKYNMMLDVSRRLFAYESQSLIFEKHIYNLASVLYPILARACHDIKSLDLVRLMVLCLMIINEPLTTDISMFFCRYLPDYDLGLFSACILIRNVQMKSDPCFMKLFDLTLKCSLPQTIRTKIKSLGISTSVKRAAFNSVDSLVSCLKDGSILANEAFARKNFVNIPEHITPTSDLNTLSDFVVSVLEKLAYHNFKNVKKSELKEKSFNDILRRLEICPNNLYVLNSTDSIIPVRNIPLGKRLFHLHGFVKANVFISAVMNSKLKDHIVNERSIDFSLLQVLLSRELVHKDDFFLSDLETGETYSPDMCMIETNLAICKTKNVILTIQKGSAVVESRVPKNYSFHRGSLCSNKNFMALLQMARKINSFDSNISLVSPTFCKYSLTEIQDAESFYSFRNDFAKLMYDHPYLFDFESRYTVFLIASLDLAASLLHFRKSFNMKQNYPIETSNFVFKVSRDCIFQHGITLINSLFKNRVNTEIKFISENGSGKGVTREFFTLLAKEFIRSTRCLFRNDNHDEFVRSKHGLFPSVVADQSLIYSLGIFVAKAIVNECFIDLEFSTAFFKLLRTGEVTLEEIDPDLHKSISDAKKLVGLTFTYPGIDDYELIPNGSNIEATEESCEKLKDCIISKTIAKAKESADSFRNGFEKVISFSCLDIFKLEEINTVISGDSRRITYSDLEAHSELCNYKKDDKQIIDLFSIISEMSGPDQSDFVMFLTGYRNLPIGGLKQLDPKFTIARKDENFTSQEEVDSHLPSVLTCTHYLKLPSYSSKEKMKEKLFKAMKDGIGNFAFT